MEDFDGPFGSQHAGKVEDQGHEVGGLATFEDDCGLEWRQGLMGFSIVDKVLGEGQGGEACGLVADGEEKDKRNEGSDADDVRPG